jgi:hypothetical protein
LDVGARFNRFLITATRTWTAPLISAKSAAAHVIVSHTAGPQPSKSEKEGGDNALNDASDKNIPPKYRLIPVPRPYPH